MYTVITGSLIQKTGIRQRQTQPSKGESKACSLEKKNLPDMITILAVMFQRSLSPLNIINKATVNMSFSMSDKGSA